MLSSIIGWNGLASHEIILLRKMNMLWKSAKILLTKIMLEYRLLVAFLTELCLLALYVFNLGLVEEDS